MRKGLVALVAASLLMAPAGGAFAQVAPILTAADLGVGWVSQGATTRTLSQGNVYRDIFQAESPAAYPPGTGVALQVVEAVSDEVRDGLVGQIQEGYGVQGYDFQAENAVGDQGVVGTMNTDDATSTMYLYTVKDVVVMVVVGVQQPNASGIDDLALNLARMQAQRLS